MEILSNFKRKRYSNHKHPPFSDINRLERQLHDLTLDSNILNIQLNSLDRSFRDLKTEFENLTDLCSKTIMKEKHPNKT